jgi:formate-dependent nitrite reductase membrane component NrfD
MSTVEGRQTMDRAEGQKSWGWLVVIYVFLAGCGGGTFLFSYMLRFLGRYEQVAKIGLLTGPVFVALGTLMLIFDLGSPARCYRLFTTPRTLASSWMVRGSWILTAFIILGLAYAMPSVGIFAWGSRGTRRRFSGSSLELRPPSSPFSYPSTRVFSSA